MEAEGLCGAVLTALVDAELAGLSFASSSGLGCPAGCCDCCAHDKPEDTALAALPAAWWALRSGLYDKIAAAEPEGPCVFFEPGAPRPCAVYPARPLICRLFAFAGSRDKHGQPRFSPCRRMSAGPGPFAGFPLFEDHSRTLDSLHPTLSEERLPINLAFQRAAAWLAMKTCFAPDGQP